MLLAMLLAMLMAMLMAMLLANLLSLLLAMMLISIKGAGYQILFKSRVCHLKVFTGLNLKYPISYCIFKSIHWCDLVWIL